MSEQISLEKVEEYRVKFEETHPNKILQNAISKNDIKDLVVNRDQISKDNHIFSIKTDPRVSVTSQKSTGRCWMFAALNILRRAVIKKYNLGKDFELSQSYLFFWDKLERMNYNLECIISTHNEDINSRIVSTILNDPVADGGQWDMVVNLVRKYGVVPKSVFGESHHSSNSRTMNAIFKRKFREAAIHIRKLMSGPDGEQKAREYKEIYNKFVFNTLCRMMGTPPTSFVWEFTDKDNKYNRFDIDSPQQFFNDHVDFELDDHICVINDPRREHEFYKLYTVQHLGNVVGGQPVKYLNVPIDHMKDITIKSLKDKEAVWFGCDVGKEHYRDDGLMSTGINEIGNLLGVSFVMTKEDRLNTNESAMTHAMVFSGVNVYEVDGQEVVDRFEVENSWGKRGDHDGFYTMTSDWYDEYMYEVVVHKKYATPEMLNALESNDMEVLPLWDPMGALA